MSKAKKPATQEEPIPFEGPQPGAAPDVPPLGEVVAVAQPQNRTLAKAQATPEVVERLNEALEALSSFNGISLPLIRFKEGFTLIEGEDEVESFEGVMIFTKESNVYYKGRYDSRKISRPDCFSPDGKKPVGDNPQAPTCAECQWNKFGSAQSGDGKACKNTRPVFVLVKSANAEEGGFGFGVIPKVLRIPPTSLVAVRNFVVAVAADFGSYYAVRTRFEVYQRSEGQTHYNIKLSVAGRLSSEEKASILAIRNGWMPQMTQGNFGFDEEHATEAPQRPSQVDTEARF
jgi:hypothetical protein